MHPLTEKPLGDPVPWKPNSVDCPADSFPFQPASVTVMGETGIEVALAGDHYRLPATVQGAPPRP